jgi:Bacterial Ig-like domain (group 2)/Cohesin domain/FlgD Ig-like domain
MKRISKRLFRRLAPCGLLLALLLTGGLANAVTFTIGTTSGQVGDVVSLPVTVTGLAEDIRAFEMDISWYSGYALCVGVNTAGTLTSTWSVSDNISPSSLTVAGASASPLAGDGVLFELLFELGPTAGNSVVSFGQVVINEGDVIPTMANGSLSISALPTINISPDSGLMAVGDSLLFSTSGGTAPYVYTSSDPFTADFNGSWLHALAPGFTRATSVDDDGISNTTTGQIEVRAFRLIVEDAAIVAGQTVLIPVTLNDPTGYGIVSSEVELTWYQPYASFAGIETAGTISEAAGWAAPVVLPGSGKVTVAMAGATPLAGSGVLFYLKLIPTNSFIVGVGTQIFNEIYPALPETGYLTVTQLPTIGVSPTTASLRVGDQIQLTATGSPTAPVTWSTDDPTVATISPSGLLSAVAEGVVRVQVLDNLGATAESGVISVCSFGLPPLVSSIEANETVMIPVTVDRSLDDLDIYSYEISVIYNPAYVTYVGAVVTGALTSSWGSPTVVDNGGTVNIYHAGATALTGCGPAVVFLEFQGQPALVGSYTGVALNTALFNEGVPCVRINTGTMCETVSAVPHLADTGLTLWPNHPNPFNPSTTIRYSLDNDGPVELAIYSARGERVRTLITGRETAGVIHSVVWDGRDDSGRVQSSGVYYTMLRSEGKKAMQKMVLIK